MNSGSCSQISSSCNCPVVSTLNVLSSRIHQDKSFHCEVCNVCLDKRLEGNHKCRPDSGHDECCICLEVSFNLLCLFQIAIISSSFNECFFKYESKPKECRRRNRMVVDAVSVTFFFWVSCFWGVGGWFISLTLEYFGICSVRLRLQ